MFTLEFNRDFQIRLFATAMNAPALMDKLAQVMRPDDWNLSAVRYCWVALLDMKSLHGTYQSLAAFTEYIGDCAATKATVACGDTFCTLQEPEMEMLACVMDAVHRLAADPVAVKNDAPYMESRLRAYLEHVRVSQADVATVGMSAREQTEARTKALRDLADVFDTATDRNPVECVYDSSCLDEDESTKVPLGIYELDQVLGGGQGVGEICLVMASTGVGKTNALLHTATSAGYHDKGALLLSLELGRKTITQRGVAMAAHVPVSHFRTNPKLRQPLDVAAVDAVLAPDYKFRDHLSMAVITDHCPTPAEIESKIVEWKDAMTAKGHEPGFCKMVAVDWLEYVSADKFMSRDKGSAGMAAALQKVLQELRQIAQRQQVAIITATQLNREAEGREVAGLKYSSHSYAMTNVCDLVLTLCPQAMPESAYNENCMPVLKAGAVSFQKMNLTIAKIRNAHGRDHVIELTRAPSLGFCRGEWAFENARTAVARKKWDELVKVVMDKSSGPFRR